MSGEEPLEELDDYGPDAAPENDETVYPFFNAQASGDVTVAVTAGWVTDDGEVQQLVLDYAGPLAQGMEALQIAFGWYADTISDLYQQQAAAEQQAAESEGVETR